MHDMFIIFQEERTPFLVKTRTKGKGVRDESDLGELARSSRTPHARTGVPRRPCPYPARRPPPSSAALYRLGLGAREGTAQNLRQEHNSKKESIKKR